MVFRWFHGDPYKKFVKRLDTLKRFAATAAQDVTTGDVTQATNAFNILSALLKDLDDRYEKNRLELLKRDREAASQIRTLLLHARYEIETAIVQLNSIKDALRSGVKPSALAQEFGGVIKTVELMQKTLDGIEAQAVRLGMEPMKRAKEGINPYAIPESSFLSRKYGVNSWTESPQFQADPETYANIRKSVEKVRKRIVATDTYVSNLHEPVQHGSIAGALHAAVGSNIRIIYRVRQKEHLVEFDRIVTKNEFDKLAG